MFSIIGTVKTCGLWVGEWRLQSVDAKPWGRSPSRWTPCGTARGFSPMSPACWPNGERAEFRVTPPGRNTPDGGKLLQRRGLLTTYQMMAIERVFTLIVHNEARLLHHAAPLIKSTVHTKTGLLARAYPPRHCNFQHTKKE